MSCGIDCLVLAQVVLRGFIKGFENPSGCPRMALVSILVQSIYDAIGSCMEIGTRIASRVSIAMRIRPAFSEILDEPTEHDFARTRQSNPAGHIEYRNVTFFLRGRSTGVTERFPCG